MQFTEPQVILFVSNPERAAGFYAMFGLRETFRTTPEAPVKIEMGMPGLTLGLSTPESARESHGLTPASQTHRACLTFWTDDVAVAYAAALDHGAVDRQPPHPFLEGRLSVAFVEDLDGHPIQLVQRVHD